VNDDPMILGIVAVLATIAIGALVLLLLLQSPGSPNAGA
jgi:hypothetical protein